MTRIPIRVRRLRSASVTDATVDNFGRRPDRMFSSASPDEPPSPLISIMLAALMVLAAAAGANCQSMKGIYALGSDTRRPIPRAVLENPDVDGIALRYAWDELEPAAGALDWTRIDRDVAQARIAHKKVSLSVTAGVRTPHWVYASGAASFSFTWDRAWGYSPCSRQSIPIPWDSIYLFKWKAFVRELGHRYAANPAVICIKVTGVNGPTQETQLPHSGGAQMPHGPLSCPGTNRNSDWVAAGYTRTRVDAAWLGIADTFAQSFPSQRLALMIGPRAFPPIDDSGHVILHKAADMKLTHELIDQGITRYGTRFVIQNNGLSAFRCWYELSAIAPRVTVGYQMLWEVTQDPGCRMNGGLSPCNAALVLQNAFNRGIGCGAQYFEVYLPDVLNPDLADEIAQTHHRLITQPSVQ